MISRTVTVQAQDDATEPEYAQATARAIMALLLSVSDEVKVLTIAAVFPKLSPEVQARIRTML